MKPNYLAILGVAALAATITPQAQAHPPHSIQLQAIGSVAAGSYATSAAEIVAHDPATQRLFVVNAQAAHIDIVDIQDPAAPAIIGNIDVTPYGAVANSVAVKNGIIAVAVESEVRTDPGHVVFFNNALQFLSVVEVGSVPDMLAFSPNGRYVLTANEGEPSTDYTIDPEGSVSVINLSGGVANLTQAAVKTAGFTAFNGKALDPSIRIFGPGATVAQDIEPEYLTISHDSKTAWVTLQENNAIAIIDIPAAKVTKLVGLGTKNHSLPWNELDASDKDTAINIAKWPVHGYYLPDGIASHRVGNHTFLLCANEGDAREYAAFAEETRVGSSGYKLDPVRFPNAVTLKEPANIGRLKTTKANGDTDGDGDYDKIYTFGGRSFSVRSSSGVLLWDSGDQFERILAEKYPLYFNASNANNTFDDRSDDKGPEPEGVVVGEAYGRPYAFIGLERVGGVMVYDMTIPFFPWFVEYANNRDFTVATEESGSGDLGPEGLLFISEQQSPNGKPLLVVSNEVSGTTTIYQVNKVKK